MSKDLGSCKYCHKPLEKVKCPNTDSSSMFGLDILFEVWHLSVYIVFLILSYISKNINKKEKVDKRIITCGNKDCIDYLKGCFNGKGLYS